MLATIRRWRQDYLSSVVSQIHVTLCEAPRYLNLREQRPPYDKTDVIVLLQEKDNGV